MTLSCDIIVPAHNEENVIERCLGSLLSSAEPDDVQVWVVANACTDNTAKLARRFGRGVNVIETDVPSKTHALNLGDSAASRFPRFYIDADVIFTTEGLHCLSLALKEPSILAVSPAVDFDYTHRPWTVRAYYEVWRRLPYNHTGIGGAGVYALSAVGRQRFGTFPDITGDDAFVRMHFAPHERKTVNACKSIVSPPTTLKSVVDIKTRSHFGNVELRRRYSHLWENEHINHKAALLRLGRQPRWWPALCVYLYVKALVRARVRRRYRRGEHRIWERDDSSRATPLTREFPATRQ